MKVISPSKIARLDDLEKVIEKHQQSAFEFGKAVMEIRDARLYERDYDSFEAYCQGRWGWGRQRAHQYIEAAKVVESLPEKCKPLVYTLPERAVRELANIPPPQRAKVIKEISAEGPITAAAIRNAVPPPPPSRKVLRCETNERIQPESMHTWNRRDEIQALLSAISKVRGALKTAQAEKDGMFVEVNFSSALSALDQAYADVKTAMPYAVCNSCKGKTPDKCKSCCGRGFLSEYRWKNTVSKEIRDMREKLSK